MNSVTPDMHGIWFSFKAKEGLFSHNLCQPVEIKLSFVVVVVVVFIRCLFETRSELIWC